MLGGVLCRIAVFTSLAFSTLNIVQVEVSTPSFVEPEGLLFCLATPNVDLSNATFSLSSLTSGGSQFIASTQDIVTSKVDLQGVSFFQVKTSLWQHNALEFGTLYDVLANDEYYASSYHRRRYDDLQAAHNRFLVASSGTTEGPPNCALLTANWQANTRYQLAFDVTNPPADGDTTASELKVWYAPITYTKIDDNHLEYGVRGGKEGQECTLSENLESYGKALYDACEVLDSVLGKQLSDPEACLSDLKAHYQSDGLPGSDQYSSLVNVHKSSTGLGIASAAVTNSTCGENEAFSPNFGGECIACGTGQVQYSQGTLQPLSCSCPQTHEVHLVGSPACGAPKSLIRDSTTPKETASALCTLYSEKYDGLSSHQTSALSVVHGYVDEFLDHAHMLIDRDAMSRLNETFVGTFMFDEREKNTPTRKGGIKPNCYSCNEGVFEDFNTGAKAEVNDVYFEAVHTFRLIGFALGSLGYPCDHLFSIEDPFKKMYGAFTDEICQNL